MIKVYSKLSLGEKDAKAILPKVFIDRPLQRGDILRDIEDGFGVIVIIDGKFHQDLAVTPSEIMDAMQAGVRVYGASSMGALRASELYPFGMIGHGLIFEHIVNTPLFRDDFLGQVFHDDNGEIRPLSITYIDFFMNLLALERKGLAKKSSVQLQKLYAGLFYSDRGWPTLKALIEKRHHGDPELLRAGRTACITMGSQKRRDALSVLRRVATDLKRISTRNQILRTSIRK